MGVTFISALFSPEKGSYRSIEKYKEYFALLAQSCVPIVLFMDPALKTYADELEKRFSNVRVIEFVTVDKSFLSKSVFLPRNRNKEKDTVEYFCIQLMKLKVMARAAEVMKSSHLAWIDFGIFHMFKDVVKAQATLREISQKDWQLEKILSPGCWSKERITDIWNYICWRHCGSFLLGERSRFITAFQSQELQVRSNMPGLTWEVNYWTLMSDFTNYSADHNDSILTNLIQSQNTDG